MLKKCLSNESGILGGASGEEAACQCRRQEMGLRTLGWEDRLEEGMATHSSILAWRMPMERSSLAGYSPWGHKELDMTE